MEEKCSQKVCKRVSPEPGSIGAEVGVGAWEMGVEPAPAPDADVPLDAKAPWSQANWVGVKGVCPPGYLSALS